MKKYRSHKVVEAAPILAMSHLVGGPDRVVVEGDRRVVDGRTEAMGEEIAVPKGFFARGTPAIGDYLVRYEDGYLSWSPKKAFEDGHSAIEREVSPFAPVDLDADEQARQVWLREERGLSTRMTALEHAMLAESDRGYSVASIVKTAETFAAFLLRE